MAPKAQPKARKRAALADLRKTEARLQAKEKQLRGMIRRAHRQGLEAVLALHVELLDRALAELAARATTLTWFHAILRDELTK